jgi:CRISPR-associated protein (Cas_Cmr5)
MKNEIILNNMEKAYQAIESAFPQNDKGEILKEYKGYIASFCTSLRQLGLMPALLNYYESTPPKPQKASGHHIITVLAKMFDKPTELDFMNTVFDAAKKEDKTELKKLEKQTIEYAITIKKTLRLFKIQS